MSTNAQRWALRFVPAVALFLAGCSTHRELAMSAVSFNRAVEQSQNEMLLLNAIRASKRQPMYISGIQKVTGGVTTQFTASLGIPFGGKNAENKGTPGATVTINPTLEVPVLDTQDFTRGFLTGIRPEVLVFYWDQGWPRELLLHLLVQKVTVRMHQDDGTPVDYTFENYPDVADPGLCELEKFTRWIDQFLATRPSFDAAGIRQDVGPPLPQGQFGNVGNLIAATQGGFEVVAVDGGYQLQRLVPKLVLPTGAETAIGRFSRELKTSLCRREAPPVSYPADSAPTLADQNYLVSSSRESKAPAVSLLLRSPEAVLYYLGQLIRVEKAQGVVPQICLGGRLEPLFVGQTATRHCLQGVITTEHEGEFFLVPRRAERETPQDCPQSGGSFHTQKLDCTSGRSMQTLSLVSQLIALQKSAKDLPATSLIRTVGD